MTSLPTSRNLMAGMLSLAIALPLLCPLAAQTTTPRVVGYYLDWSRGTYTHQTIQYKDITHVAHAFLIPAADGSLSGAPGFAYAELVQAAHQAGVQVIVVLGGWDQSAGFSPMAADTTARRRFIQNVLNFIVSNGYDGVDLDCEYPANAADSMNFTSLVRELRSAFSTINRPLSISLAVPATHWSGRWRPCRDASVVVLGMYSGSGIHVGTIIRVDGTIFFSGSIEACGLARSPPLVSCRSRLLMANQLRRTSLPETPLPLPR